MKNKITLLNIVSSLILQLITLISGFLIPKIILMYFGSEVNGLVSSLNQFLNYIALVEGGITGVIMANLYKPLHEKDNNKISSIIKATRQFYKKIGYLFILYTIVLAIVYPLVFKSTFSYTYIFSLTIILSLSLFIQYMFSLTLRNLLNADKKVYIVSFVQTLILFINVILIYVSVKLYPSIHLLKFISGILFVFQPIIFNSYVKKNYQIDDNIDEDKKIISSRWDGFAINVAAFIHNGTDIVVLTFFTNFSTISIYSIYALISSGLKQIINSITSGINPTLGKAYASGNTKDLNQKLDLYEYITFILVFWLFSVAILLITPFVLLYTKGINDANYDQMVFGIILLISEAIYLLKFPHLNLAYSSNKFKEISKSAFIEAILNIIISVILVLRFGLIGVSIGTVIAMIYRLIFHVWYTKKIIPSRTQWIFYNKLIVFLIPTIIGFLICYFIPCVPLDFYSWILYAILYVMIFGILYFIISLLVFKKELLFFKNYLFGKK